MTRLILLFGLVVGMASISACSWIEPLPGALHVPVMKADEVTNCEKVGTANTSTLNKVGLYERDKQAIKKDLIALARNEAIRMHGDTLVEMTPVKNGAMEFAIYRCLNK